MEGHQLAGEDKEDIQMEPNNKALDMYIIRMRCKKIYTYRITLLWHKAHRLHPKILAFSHPDYTVGPGTPPGPATLAIRVARGLYRRSGIGKQRFPHLAPKTEQYSIFLQKGVTDGARTHNRWSHNPELYLLELRSP
jgi:hypothetical protein